MTFLREDFQFRSPADGYRIEGTFLIPENPRGILQIVHGMAEHKERYIGFMEALCAAGYAAVIHNHRGHGNCPVQGHFGDAGAEGMLADTFKVAALAKERLPALPLYLFGHSMGSLVARCCFRRDPLQYAGLIVCGTPYAPPALIGFARAFIALKILWHKDDYLSGTIDHMVSGAFNKKIPEPFSVHQWISFNEENVRAYDADPQCGFCFTLNGFRGLMELMRETYSKGKPAPAGAGRVRFISGEEDPCHTGIRNFCRAVARMQREGYRVSARLFPAMRHEILLEKDAESVIEDILNELEQK